MKFLSSPIPGVVFLRVIPGSTCVGLAALGTPGGPWNILKWIGKDPVSPDGLLDHLEKSLGNMFPEWVRWVLDRLFKLLLPSIWPLARSGS